jgi:hypothetical protein
VKVQILPSPFLGSVKFAAKQRHYGAQDGELWLELIGGFRIQQRGSGLVQQSTGQLDERQANGCMHQRGPLVPRGQ